ncbi:hypothetical protein [Paractinoplanes lichenicola]|uniref:Rpn family recombination-promoting nuclease/putative transposase n=1 Tax=Paractinoplanes lichenicola TaxID=2802976 RepID=A0ABS1VW97_9ACTN|nr:hypothetical protein [Actinoplanes lichenicola]MBL7258757.1 hypothetical protein [Actinoplanes lichenicola]
MNDSKTAAPRDFDGLYKALVAAHPRDALRQLCGVRLNGEDVILEGPTELPRQRSRQTDKTFLVHHNDGAPTDVYHFEFQVQRTEDFQERMVYYWASLALKYRSDDHRIHQVVLWPVGKGYPGRFRRDQAQLDYRSINVPDDLDPAVLLDGPLAPLALWSKKPPPDLVERVADRIEATDAVEEQLVQVELSMLVGRPLANEVLKVLQRRGMSNVLEQSELGRQILEKGLEKGLEKAREEARVGRVGTMRKALHAGYGDIDDLDELAQRLSGSDHDGNIARIVGGAKLEDLRS